MIRILAGVLLALGGTTALAQSSGPAPGETIYPEPEYVSKPSNEDWRRIRPSDGKGGYPGGESELLCRVELDGRLTACRITDQSEEGQTFGKLAMKMIALHKAKPHTKDGQPIAAWSRIPVKLVNYTLDMPTTRPEWFTRPSEQAIREAWPKGADGEPVRGRVALYCTLTTAGRLAGCETAVEEPAGVGLSDMLLKFAPQYSTAPAIVDGRAAARPIAVALQHGMSDQVVTNPDWVKTPNADDLSRSYPAAAMAEGASGRATIECKIAIEGNLYGCRVISEEPEGMGFGPATVSVAPLFRMKPPMLDGKPMTGASVRVPLRWVFKGGGKGPSGPKTAQILRPTWTAAPTRAELDAAYPSRGAGRQGLVTLDCAVSPAGKPRQCKGMEETPKGGGFTGAALSLVGKFQLERPETDRETVGMRVRVPFTFTPPGTASADLSSASVAAGLSGLPDGMTMEKVFPAAAREAGLTQGRAVVTCRVAGGGALEQCRMSGETPAGMGFGAAALDLAKAFRLTLWTQDGKPTQGALINLPIRLVDPPAQPAS